MVKILSIAFLLTVLPLTLGFPQSLPRRHVQSTFDLNRNNNFESITEGFRLIQTSEDQAPEWMDQGEIMTLFRKKIKFMDVTDYLELGTHYKSTLKHGKFSFCFSSEMMTR